MSEIAIRVDSLTKRFGANVALNGVSFEVSRGSIAGFVGRNGAGKTTTLRVIATLLRPDSGRATVDSHDTATGFRDVRRVIGYLPDTIALPAEFTLNEYLDSFAGFYGFDARERARRVDTVLQLTGTAAHATRRLRGLSRGEQQRIGLARALIHNPAVLVLDEPASGLDPHARVELKELLRLLREMGKTILFSSHILADIEEVCDSLVVISEGATRFQGTIDEFRERLARAEYWRVHFASPIPTQLHVPEGIDLERAGDRELHVRGAIDDASRARLVAALAAQGCSICELSPVRSSLESEFARLVEGGQW